MGFFEKVKWVLGILMVFTLILTTNLIDRNNFLRVKESVASIYEDRLIAYDLIFDMSTAVHQKEIAMASSDSAFYLEENAAVNERISSWISSFKQTKLTLVERNIFTELGDDFEALKQAEKILVESKFTDKKPLTEAMAQIKESLHDLSEIQLSEGKKQVSISNNAVDMVELFTHIEIYVLIFLAILIQVVVMYKSKEN